MAFDNIYVKGATSVIIQVMMRDSSTGMGKTGITASAVTASYCRSGSTRNAITPTISAVGAAYAVGKWAEVDATNMSGLYQFHLPDASLVTGAESVEISLKTTGVLDKSTKIVLIDANLRDTMRLGLTALPNVNAGASGGLPLGVDASGRVDVLKINGTTQTARDIGASVLLSPGTGTGQLDFTSGVVKSNLVQILASAISGTAAQISAAFTKFFDKASPTGTVNSLPDAVAGASGGLPTTNGTKVTQTVDLTAGQSIAVSDKTGFSLSTAGILSIWHQATAAIVTASTIGKKLVDWALGADNKVLISTEAQDLSATLDVNAKKLGGATPNNLGGTAQTGDSYAVVNSGTHGNAALLTAIQNVQNGTFVSATVPSLIEKPDTSYKDVTIVVLFTDPTGVPANLDSGNPILTLVNDDNVDKSSRMQGSWANPSTGIYTKAYRNSATDAIEGLHWNISGVVGGKTRMYVQYMQVVDTTAIDFTQADRDKLENLHGTQVPNLQTSVDALPTLVEIEASTVLAKEATLTTIDGNVDDVETQVARIRFSGTPGTEKVIADAGTVVTGDVTLAASQPNLASTGIATATEQAAALTAIQQKKFTDGYVHVNTTEGVAGTAYPLGEPITPVSNLIEAIAIARANKMDKIMLKLGASQLAVSVDVSMLSIVQYGTEPGVHVALSHNLISRLFAQGMILHFTAAVTAGIVYSEFRECDHEYVTADVTWSWCRFFQCNFNASGYPFRTKSYIYFKKCDFNKGNVGLLFYDVSPSTGSFYFDDCTGRFKTETLNAGSRLVLTNFQGDIVIGASVSATAIIEILGGAGSITNLGSPVVPVVTGFYPESAVAIAPVDIATIVGDVFSNQNGKIIISADGKTVEKYDKDDNLFVTLNRSGAGPYTWTPTWA